MDIKELKTNISDLKKRVSDTLSVLDLEDDQNRIKEIEFLMKEKTFWDDSENAKNITKEFSDLKESLDSWERIKKEINETRNMLYRLHEANLISFIRKKDKKKGWYIYYWTFKPKMIKHLIIRLKKDKLAKLKDRLSREKSSHFFICQNKCIRLDFDQAMNFKFKCPECGEIMNQEDNLENIRLIEEEIKNIKDELK